MKVINIWFMLNLLMCYFNLNTLLILERQYTSVFFHYFVALNNVNVIYNCDVSVLSKLYTTDN